MNAGPIEATCSSLKSARKVREYHQTRDMSEIKMPKGRLNTSENHFDFFQQQYHQIFFPELLSNSDYFKMIPLRQRWIQL